MSSPSADSPAPPAPAESWLPGPKPPSEGWTRKKFYYVLAFVFAFHVSLIFLFGTKKQALPRAVTNVPHLQLAGGSDELIALRDPTLFARPNSHDLVTSFWRQMPAIPQPAFNWTEPPRYLPPSPENFGAAFREFMGQSRVTELPMNFKPDPALIVPEPASDNALPVATTSQITGDLAQRQLLTTNVLNSLPSLPRNDVLAPTTLQAVVDSAGNVLQTVVLQTSGDNDADQLALQLVRNLRFAPAVRLTFGEITFTWHTVPANTAPSNAP